MNAPESGDLFVNELTVNNYGILKHVHIKPTGNVIEITGLNNQGKSTTIQSIFTAIGGASEKPTMPIKKGADKAEIYLDLGDLKVTRKFTPKGDYIEVKTKEGFLVQKAQTILDTFYKKTTMDCKTFIEKTDKERIADLINFTGKADKIGKLNTESKQAYDDRTLVNREITTLKGKLVNAPTEEVKEESVGDLVILLRNKNDEIRKLEDYEEECSRLEFGVKDGERELAELLVSVEEVRADIARFKERLEKGKTFINPEKKAKLTEETQAISKRIYTAETTNAKARAYQTAQDNRKELAEKETESQALTDKIKKCTEDKLNILQSSGAIIEGLSVENDTLYLNGIPFSDLGTSAKLIAWMRIMMSQNPKLRILRINGNELDSTNLEKVRAWATENRIQVWVEKLAEAPKEGAIYIHEGEIVE